MSSDAPILIIGAGLAGLAAGRELDRRGDPFRILEASARVGGRLGSTVVDGIVCDLGFQVSMSNYRSLEALVPRTSLPRRPFIPGAIVWTGTDRIRVVDPRRAPLGAFQAVFRGLAGWRDLRAAARCRRAAARATSGVDPTGTADRFIRDVGFSERFRESFLRPFFGGVFLDESLSVSAGRFLRTLDRFSSGNAELPRGGMQAIADAMAEPILDRIDFGRSVTAVDADSVVLDDGERLEAGGVILAADQDATDRLLGDDPHAASEGETASRWSSTVAVHFETPEATIREPIIVLNGSGTGEVNLVASSTAVTAGVAPKGRHSLTVSLRPGGPTDPDQAGLERIAREAASMLDVESRNWRHLATTAIRRALPVGPPPASPPPTPDRVEIAGDWLGEPSIDAAVRSGIDAVNRMAESTPSEDRA
ncbi:MAG: FAD-dependent oxidoreductase [Planctomycetota bacterium]|jgi:protoporphyrinogen oxidase